MKKIVIILLFLSVISSIAFSEERPSRSFNLGVGYFGGVPATKFDIKSTIVSDIFYWNMGVAMADSSSQSPPKDLRRITVAYVDAIVYLWDNYYFGYGLNYPLSITGGDKPVSGFETYFGIDLPYQFFAELGYSELRREGAEPFANTHFMLGWSLVLSRPEPGPIEEKEEVMEVQVVKRPTAEAEEKESADIERARAELASLEADLDEVEDYLDVLTKQMIAARKAGDTVKFLELQKMEQEAMERDKSLKERIEKLKTKYPELRQYRAAAAPKAGPPVEAPARTVETPRPVVAAAASQMVYHYVTIGDTLAGISRQYFGTPAYYKEIASANGLSDPNAIYQGMQLKIDMGMPGRAPVREATPRPAAGKIVYHTVSRGETLMSISRRYFYGDASYFDDIARLNGLSDANALNVGMRIKVDTGLAGIAPAPVPVKTAAPVRVEEAPVPTVKVEEPAQVVPVTGTIVFHYVNPGDSLASISQRYFGSPDYAEDIAKANFITDPDNVPLGTRLKIDLSIKR